MGRASFLCSHPDTFDLFLKLFTGFLRMGWVGSFWLWIFIIILIPHFGTIFMSEIIRIIDNVQLKPLWWDMRVWEKRSPVTKTRKWPALITLVQWFSKLCSHDPFCLRGLCLSGEPIVGMKTEWLLTHMTRYFTGHQKDGLTTHPAACSRLHAH